MRHRRLQEAAKLDNPSKPLEAKDGLIFPDNFMLEPLKKLKILDPIPVNQHAGEMEGKFWSNSTEEKTDRTINNG